MEEHKPFKGIRAGGSGSNEAERTSLGRRRLLKAAGTIPAVATLYSGAARANLSSYQCIAKSEALQRTEPVKPLFQLGEADSERWYEVAGPYPEDQVVDVGVFAQQGSNGTEPIVLVKYVIDGATGDSRWYNASGEEFTEVGGADKVKDASGQVYDREQNTETPVVYSAYYVDDEGRVLGASPYNSVSGTAVMHSCWASVNGLPV